MFWGRWSHCHPVVRDPACIHSYRNSIQVRGIVGIVVYHLRSLASVTLSYSQGENVTEWFVVFQLAFRADVVIGQTCITSVSPVLLELATSTAISSAPIAPTRVFIILWGWCCFFFLIILRIQAGTFVWYSLLSTCSIMLLKSRFLVPMSSAAPLVQEFKNRWNLQLIWSRKLPPKSLSC